MYLIQRYATIENYSIHGVYKAITVPHLVRRKSECNSLGTKIEFARLKMDIVRVCLHMCNMLGCWCLMGTSNLKETFIWSRPRIQSDWRFFLMVFRSMSTWSKMRRCDDDWDWYDWYCCTKLWLKRAIFQHLIFRNCLPSCKGDIGLACAQLPLERLALCFLASGASRLSSDLNSY